MLKINIFEAKARLSRYLKRVEQGERVVICKRNRPVAELRPFGGTRRSPRPVGGVRASFAVPPSFFAPLPGDLLDTFDRTIEEKESKAPQVAERPETAYGSNQPPTTTRAPKRRTRR